MELSIKTGKQVVEIYLDLLNFCQKTLKGSPLIIITLYQIYVKNIQSGQNSMQGSRR